MAVFAAPRNGASKTLREWCRGDPDEQILFWYVQNLFSSNGATVVSASLDSSLPARQGSSKTFALQCIILWLLLRMLAECFLHLDKQREVIKAMLQRHLDDKGVKNARRDFEFYAGQPCATSISLVGLGLPDAQSRSCRSKVNIRSAGQMGCTYGLDNAEPTKKKISAAS